MQTSIPCADHRATPILPRISMLSRISSRLLRCRRQTAPVLSLLTEALPTADPCDDIEPDLPIILAESRDPKFSGRKRKNDKLREFGKVPALLNCIPADDNLTTQQILSIDTTHFLRVIKTVGGNDAFFSHVLRMKLFTDNAVHDYRVLPRQLRLSNVTFKPNNATFRVLKKDDIVCVTVPISIVGEDSCPGLKKNAFPLLTKYKLTIKCRGDNVPASLIADISQLDFNDRLHAKDLPLPPGCTYLNVDPKECVCKISPFK